ncbi:metalloprotein [Rodentibacter rarus]|uniref:Metalloprotein n=1 Tax=Rodentibacter rarus TaxID=1908260 RepID=A0A1V3ILQ2_9PAST|nr:VOC family protein [Rodentibacter rarus]OOF42838.1 metalloprotein [Rodentibacter rarus]OOF42855.1 metalloprotein [Rodentibacter rarus]
MIIFNENLTALQLELIDFEDKIQALASVMKLDLKDYEIDHLALRVNSEQNAKIWLTRLLKCGRILSDNIVNGRSIYLIQLERPLAFAGQLVDVIELPFPKNKQYLQETWEHIEIVIPFLADESIEAWIGRINRQFLWQHLTQLTIKVSEPKVEGERLPNPSIAVSFADKSANHTCIKVHPYSIKKILEV